MAEAPPGLTVTVTLLVAVTVTVAGPQVPAGRGRGLGQGAGLSQRIALRRAVRVARARDGLGGCVAHAVRLGGLRRGHGGRGGRQGATGDGHLKAQAGVGIALAGVVVAAVHGGRVRVATADARVGDGGRDEGTAVRR